MKTSNKEIKALALSVFPDYKGRKFFVQPTETVTFTNTNWSEGSCTQYKAVMLINGKVQAFHAPAPWVNSVEGKTVALPVNHAVITRAVHCGLECGLTVYLNPANMPMALQVAA